MNVHDNYPLVSVGVPIYNRPDDLKTALKAVVSQSYKNMEIIISDNASPDKRIEEIIREHMKNDDRIIYYRQEKNIGFISNFKFVFDKAKGKYFAWAADDDIWEMDFLKECMGPLLKPNSKVALSFCHVKTKRPGTGEIVFSRYSDNISTVNGSFAKTHFKYIVFSKYLHYYYGVYRKEVIGSIFFEKRFGVDHMSIMSVLKHGSIFISDKVLFQSTIGGSGFIRENFHKYYDQLSMKILVNLSSTLVWYYEYLRYVYLDKNYSLYQKFLLTIFITLKFLKPQFIKRFCGDFLALVTKPGIWKFKNQ